jgi:stage II sporulation protein D
MLPRYQMEALKAQAIAARTYSIARRGNHSQEFADLCDSVHCQLYLGMGAENTRTTQAVIETKGLVALYQGKPIDSLYSADCGGFTCANQNRSYLRSVCDRLDSGSVDFCAGAPQHQWSISLTESDLQPVLAHLKQNKFGPIKELCVTETDPSGRAANLKIRGDSGEFTFPASLLRKIIGLSKIPSTRFTLEAVDSGGWRLMGSGSGHGVGMCQEGANGMASPPYNQTYCEILQHYYQGIEVKPLP